MQLWVHAGVLESTDGGATWSRPIPITREVAGNPTRVWIEYDPQNDLLYLFKVSGDLHRLERLP